MIYFLLAGLLWIFGDSVSSQFYHQIKFHPLCQHHFVRCMYSYNWLYSLENYNASLGRYLCYISLYFHYLQEIQKSLSIIAITATARTLARKSEPMGRKRAWIVGKISKLLF